MLSNAGTSICKLLLVIFYALSPIHSWMRCRIAAQIIQDGAVAIKDGQIVCVDTKDIVMDRHHGAQIHDFKDHLVTAGFVDAHVHYPQTAMIASWGKRLIDWLNTYTFPEESKFGDPDYANAIAARYLDLGIAHGTTTMASFCTIHPESVDAFFHAASVRIMCVVAGKTCMDRNAPDNLRDTPQTAYDHSKALLEKWHGVGIARALCHYTTVFTHLNTGAALCTGELMGRTSRAV